MTYSPPPPRPGMPPWAKWSLFGCTGCLLVAVLGFGGCMLIFWQTVGKNMKPYDASGKPDAPLTATAAQLLPPRVGSFVRQKASRTPQTAGSRGNVTGWQGSYASKTGQKVELMVMPTGGRQPGSRGPFGGPQGQNPAPGAGFRMSINVGGKAMEMVIWSKPNWTYTVQSPDMVAVQFADAYRPLAR